MEVEVVRTVNELRTLLDRNRNSGKTIGFVPTMGYLHAGHASLINASNEENDLTVVSIFVNPTQFLMGEDLSRYPKDFNRDQEVVSSSGGSVIFLPSVEEMYPEVSKLKVTVGEIGQVFEGESRPGHFDGVATIVNKFLQIVQANALYLGEKDYQQSVVIAQLIRDFFIPVQLRILPTVREPNGLAMSSRNSYLTEQERQLASEIHSALNIGRVMIENGERTCAVIENCMASELLKFPQFTVDYLSAVRPSTFEHPEIFQHNEDIVLLAAVKIGSTRLIDNLYVRH